MRGTKRRKQARAQASGMKSKMVLKFFTLVGTIVGSFIIVAGIGVFAFMRPASAEEARNEDREDSKTVINAKEPEEDKEGFLNKLLLPPKKTNFLVLGTDQSDMLADVIILGSFDRDTLDIDLLNVPRDTYVVPSSDLKEFLNSNGRYPPSYLKMTELHSYGGADYGGEAVKRHLQESFDIEIDYIVHVDIDAFKEIVDTVGPITVEVPAGGLYYYDPTQNLRINIPGGMQEMDGDMAEGFVRYRSYKMGDIDRIEMQQRFMKALFQQTLEKETLIKNAASLISTFFEYVDTDFELTSAPKYIPYIAKLSGENLKTQTLPGVPVNRFNGEVDVSFWDLDMKECQRIIDDVFYSTGFDVNPAELKVQLFNGGESVGSALDIKDMLTEQGHQVVYGGTYEGALREETRIIVRYEEHADEIKTLFDLAEVIEDDELPVDYDAVIIVGLGKQEEKLEITGTIAADPADGIDPDNDTTETEDTEEDN